MDADVQIAGKLDSPGWIREHGRLRNCGYGHVLWEAAVAGLVEIEFDQPSVSDESTAVAAQ